MKTYELAYIVSPDVTSEEAHTKTKEIETAIQSRDGVIIKQSVPVAKTLSYPIKSKSSGFFGTMEFQLEPEKLVEVKDALTRDAKILRNMITVKETPRKRKERRSKDKMPSIMGTIKEKIGEMMPKHEEKKDKVVADRKPAPAFADEPKEESNIVEKVKVELKDIEEELKDILG